MSRRIIRVSSPSAACFSIRAVYFFSARTRAVSGLTRRSCQGLLSAISAKRRYRMISTIKKPIFNELRDSAGGSAELLDSRIEVIEGDLPNVPELPADLDVVVHCAGDVSFDPPIDQALTTNVIGTKALMDRMLQAVSRRLERANRRG